MIAGRIIQQSRRRCCFYDGKRNDLILSIPNRMLSVKQRWSSCNTRCISSSKSRLLPVVRWLDLRGSGLCILERLLLEEALLRHTNDNWVLIGAHDVWPPKYLRYEIKKDSGSSSGVLALPNYVANNNTTGSNVSAAELNRDCMIVMGIGGKPNRLLNIDKVIQDKVLVVKRFSGGGTVVMNHNAIWTTLIGRTQDFPEVEPFPRSIMEWSAKEVFGPAFDSLTVATASSLGIAETKKTLVMDSKSCSATENLGKVLFIPKDDTQTKENVTVPQFSLRENDYVLGGDFKMGGNAQTIVKGGWLHHTSFLWDYEDYHMENYLKLPDKRPDYRQSRSHREFLVPLSKYFGKSYTPFVQSLREACLCAFYLQNTHLPMVVHEVINGDLGGMEAWFARCRTRIVHDLDN
jgi:lipoate-protein ligase A